MHLGSHLKNLDQFYCICDIFFSSRVYFCYVHIGENREEKSPPKVTITYITQGEGYYMISHLILIATLII